MSWVSSSVSIPDCSGITHLRDEGEQVDGKVVTPKATHEVDQDRVKSWRQDCEG